MGKSSAVTGRVLKRQNPGEMNKTEAAYARRLDLMAREGEIVEWWFESVKLRVGKLCHYSPDFLVVMPDGELQIHEVKGSRRVFTDDAKVKLRACANKYPLRFYVAFPTKGGGWDIDDYTEYGTD